MVTIVQSFLAGVIVGVAGTLYFGAKAKIKNVMGLKDQAKSKLADILGFGKKPDDKNKKK